jgi:hypothetical protein
MKKMTQLQRTMGPLCVALGSRRGQPLESISLEKLLKVSQLKLAIRLMVLKKSSRTVRFIRERLKSSKELK